MNNKVLIKKAENQVRQQLVGGLMLMVVGLMIINTFVGFPSLVKAANTDVLNLSFVVTAGTFSIDNVTTSIAFASQGYGVANNVVGNSNIDTLAVTDYRGSSTAWSVVVNANDFSDGTNIISATGLKVWPQNGVVTNVENAVTTRVGRGTNNTAISGAGTGLINGANNASGIFRYDNGVLRLTLSGTEAAGTYGATATFTLS